MKRSILLLAIYLISIIGFAQKDTIIYYGGNKKPSDFNNAIEYDQIKKLTIKKYELSNFMKFNNSWQAGLKQQIIIENDSMLLITTPSNNKKISEKKRKLHLLSNGNYYFKDYYENGNILMEGETMNKFPLFLLGEVREYYENGEIKKISVYELNQLKTNKLFNDDGSEYMENVFETVDIKPEYPGGEMELIKFIAENTKYPKIAMENGIQGTVYVGFVVLEDGSIGGIRLIRGVDPVLDNESMRVVKSIKKKWKPAVLDGKNVRFALIFPVRYKLT